MNAENRPLPSLTTRYSNEAKCICNANDNHLILCKICGCLTKGRIMSRCPVHPRVYHLMDLTHCPRCHGALLIHVARQERC